MYDTTTRKPWEVAKDALLAVNIKPNDPIQESYLRSLFGIPFDGELRTEAEVNERNLFFTTQFNYLKTFFLKEHKLLIDRERGKGGFVVVLPKDHARRTSRKSIVAVKRELSRAKLSIDNVDIDSVPVEERQKVMDDIARFNSFSTAVRGDAKAFRKLSHTMLAKTMMNSTNTDPNMLPPKIKNFGKLGSTILTAQNSQAMQ